VSTEGSRERFRVDRSGRRPAWRIACRTLGELLVTAGLVLLLFVAYELWWTGLTTRHDQHKLVAALRQEWARGVTVKDPPVGSALAILRIPRLGRTFMFAVVQGTSTADLI